MPGTARVPRRRALSIGQLRNGAPFVQTRRGGAKRRRRVSASFQRLHRTHERPAQAALRRFFDSVAETVVGRLKRAGTASVIVEELFNPAQHADDFNATMNRHWRGFAAGGTKFERDWIESAGERQSALRQAADTPPTFHVELSETAAQRIEDWLAERRHGVWAKVGRTTEDVLRRSILAGIREGDTFDQMADRITGRMKSFSHTEALRVARTETTGGMNFAGMLERDDQGIEHKEWVSVIDARNRGANPKSLFNHLAPDGQIKPNSEPFIVSGQQMLYPGDRSHGASAGNIVHCRCAGVAAFPEDEPKKVKPKPKK